MPLYFAYGSNMDADAMAQRCPASRIIGTARLARHRFMISTDGYASVVRDQTRTVYGLLWDLALADVRALDRYEGLSSGLYTKGHVSVIAEQGARKALIYFGTSAQPGAPRPGYMEDVLRAADAAKLPDAYLRELAGWLQNRAPHAAQPAASKPAVTPRAAAPASSVTARPRKPGG